MKQLLSPAALKLCVDEGRSYTASDFWLHVVSTAMIVKAMGSGGTPPRRVMGKKAKAERFSLGIRRWASVVRHAT